VNSESGRTNYRNHRLKHATRAKAFNCAAKNGFVTPVTTRAILHYEMLRGREDRRKLSRLRATTENRPEANFYFKLSASRRPIIDWYACIPIHFQPEARETKFSASSKAASALSPSPRTSRSLGASRSRMRSDRFYVWFDALTRISAQSAARSMRKPDSEPADLHSVGKEISRFHAVYGSFLDGCRPALAKQVWGPRLAVMDSAK